MASPSKSLPSEMDATTSNSMSLTLYPHKANVNKPFCQIVLKQRWQLGFISYANANSLLMVAWTIERISGLVEEIPQLISDASLCSERVLTHRYWHS